MGKYLVLWEVVPGTVPANAKEAGPAFLAMTEMVKGRHEEGAMQGLAGFPGSSERILHR